MDRRFGPQHEKAFEILEKTKKGKYCFEDSATDDNPFLEEARKQNIFNRVSWIQKR